MKYLSFILIPVIFFLAPFGLLAFTSSSISTDSAISNGGSTSVGGSVSYGASGSTATSTYSGPDFVVQNSSVTASNVDGVNDLANASYAPAVCEVYIKDYIRVGANTNAPQDVKNLQAFLNTTQGEKLIVDGVYKDADVAAVKRFQTRYIETLKFWGLTEATGQVLQTTINKINTMQCERNQRLTCPYFGGYQKLGVANPEVVKIKKFLNNTQGESLDTSSNKFDNALFEAVKRFQSKYLGTALKPWGITTATGFWYQSTRKTAHDVIGCFEAVRLDNGVVLR